MLQSVYRKEWYVSTCIAKGFLGTPVGSRIPTITEYAEEFSCSRGIVQNALSYLEGEKVILLDRQGKRGTFLMDKNEAELFRCSSLSHLTASMPPPINRHFAGLATGICQGMNKCPVPFTFAFVQGSKNRVEFLLSGAYDFVVTTRYSAELYASQYPELEIAFPFEGCQYALPHKLYINQPGKTWVESGMTIAVDPSSFDQVAITRKICQGKRVKIQEMPFVSAIYGFYSGEIDCLVFRDGIDSENDNLLNLVMQKNLKIDRSRISEIPIPGSDPSLEEAVALIHRDNYGIRGILKNYLRGTSVGDIQKKVMDGTMLPQFY